MKFSDFGVAATTKNDQSGNELDDCVELMETSDATKIEVNLMNEFNRSIKLMDLTLASYSRPFRESKLTWLLRVERRTTFLTNNHPREYLIA